MAARDMLQSIVDRASAAAALTRKEVRAGKTLHSIFERSAAAVTLRPAIGQGTDATTVRLRDGATCDIEEGAWQLTAGAPSELGGSGEHPSADVFLRAALGICLAQTTALWAAKFGVPIDGLDVEVENDHDACGLLGVGGAAPRLQRLRYRITAESTAPAKAVRRVLEAAHAHSPVRDSLEHAFTIERDVQVVAPTE